MRSLGQATRRMGATVPWIKSLLLIAVAAVAYATAYELRFEFSVPLAERSARWMCLPVLLLARAMANTIFRLHRLWWRAVSIPDLIAISLSTALGSAVFVGAIRMMELSPPPRSVMLLEPLLSFVLMGGLLAGNRWIYSLRTTLGTSPGRKVLVLGAGHTGSAFAHELLQMAWGGQRPVAFLDDDRRKLGMRVHGVPVIGTIADLADAVAQHSVDEIVIATPGASGQRMREIAAACRETGLRSRTVPHPRDLATGRVSVSRLREVQIQDLLRRSPITLDLSNVRPLLRDSCILVAGAAGSIGSELCRQIATCRPSTLVMVDHNENQLHFLQEELKQAHPNIDLVPVLADVTDEMRIEQLFLTHVPRIVFQAAAYKHVPLMERSPCDAVRNNVGGTRILAEAASRHHCERFVMISTDKAIRPTSIMGSTKRVAELLIERIQRSSETRFVIVRFGNVLGSNGSVVPLFREQIARGGPVTVTHPDVVRFFMLVSEAVYLVLQATVLGEGGKILLLDMGEPVRILDLAIDMIRLSGLEPNLDIELRVTGLRPGEKLYEELLTDHEQASPTAHPKVFQLAHELDSGNVDGLIESALPQLEAAALAGDSDAVRRLLRELVPEFTPWADSLAPAAAARMLLRPGPERRTRWTGDPDTVPQSLVRSGQRAALGH